MIIAALFRLFADFAVFLVGLFPSMYAIPTWMDGFLKLLATALFFFPADVLIAIVCNIVFCKLALISWSIIEWVYKKIPGVD